MAIRLSNVLLILFVTAFCMAQEEKPKQPEPTRGSLQKFDRAKAQSERADRQIRRLRRRLNLDEEQAAQFDEIAKKFRDSKSEGDGALTPFFDEVEKILLEDQIETLEDFRAGMSQKRGRGRGLLARLTELRADLKLNDEQAEQYDALHDELKAAVAPGAGDGAQDELIKEIMQAAKDGDEDRIRELRDKLTVTSSPNTNKLVEDFLSEVNEFLEPEQRRTLEQFKRSTKSRGRGVQLSDCFRHASRLDLDRDQRGAVRDLQKEAGRAEREARRDPDALRQVFDDYVAQLRELLPEEQCAEFDRWLDEEKAKQRGDRKRGDRGRRKDHRGKRPNRPPGKDAP